MGIIFFSKMTVDKEALETVSLPMRLVPGLEKQVFSLLSSNVTKLYI